MRDPANSKPRFSHLKEMLKRHKKANNKATAELEASKDPMGYIQKMKNPSINGLSGVAMYKGGIVRRK